MLLQPIARRVLRLAHPKLAQRPGQAVASGEIVTAVVLGHQPALKHLAVQRLGVQRKVAARSISICCVADGLPSMCAVSSERTRRSIHASWLWPTTLGRSYN